MSKIDLIRNSVSDEQIFQLCFNEAIVLNSNTYRNPCRNDKEGSNSFFLTRGRIKFTDFATGKVYDCFDMVQEYYGLSSTKEAIDFVIDRFGLSSSTYNSNNKVQIHKVINTLKNNNPSKVTQHNKVEFNLKYREYLDSDIEFFNSANISLEILRKYNIAPLESAVMLNPAKNFKGVIYTHNLEINDPCFAYSTELGNIKLYRPFSKNNLNDKKWLSNLNKEEVLGMKELKEDIKNKSFSEKILIIASGLRDMLCIRQAGFLTIAPNSENSTYSARTMQLLNKLKERGFKIAILYDNDDAGKRNSDSRAMETGFKNLKLGDISLPPEASIKIAKDVTDINTYYGTEQLRTLINYLLNN